MKFFWRAKRDDAQSAALLKTQSDATDEAAAETSGSAQEAGSKGDMASQAPAANENSEVDAKRDAEKQDASQKDSDNAETAQESNVVALQPSRLTERIAAAAVKTVTTLTPSEPVASVPQRVPAATPSVAKDAGTITPRAAGPLPGQEAAYDLLDRLVANPRAAGSILVLGPMGSGRRRAIETQLERHRDVMARPHDWLYVVSAAEGGRLRSFAMPHGQGTLLAREAKAAISKARANHERLVASDEFRLGLEIIDEEFRHKSGKTLETLKRRAEEQNIALVKTPDGFVLAPMHEGKVVRNDVFRALPEKLQRDVEAKIADLEGELKAFIEAIPDDDTHHAERIASFNRDAAARAVKPHLEPVRLAFNDCADFVDELQASLVAATAAAQRSAEGDGARSLPAALTSVQVLNVQTAADFSQPAPVVLAQDVTPAGLLGEIGVDAAGQLALAPGALARANGGYLVLEAWRLVADPSAWCVLSRVLAEGAMRPLVRGGLMLEVDPLPFSGRLIVVADEASYNKLLALDPGARRYFPHVVRFRASLPRSAFDVADYAAFAAMIAQQSGLRSIASNAAEALYRSALADSSDDDQLKLDTHALVNLLHDADVEAAASGAAHIRAHDIETAVKRAAEARLT